MAFIQPDSPLKVVMIVVSLRLLLTYMPCEDHHRTLKQRNRAYWLDLKPKLMPLLPCAGSMKLLATIVAAYDSALRFAAQTTFLWGPMPGELHLCQVSLRYSQLSIDVEAPCSGLRLDEDVRRP